MKIFITSLIILLILSCNKKNKETEIVEDIYIVVNGYERENAEKDLKEALTHKVKHPDNSRKIKSVEGAIKIAEPVLFQMYGKENILKQRPYKVIDFNDYYVINGTLDRPAIGGTFQIILDKNNNEIIKIDHGE